MSNGSNIEENIERLNKLVTTKFNNDYSIDNIDKEAIEHLLSDYTRQKQINEEHQKINGELREKVTELENTIKKISELSSNNEELIEKLNSGETFTVNQLGFIKKNFIPKQKIKDKIEELRNEKEQLRIEKGVLWDSGIYKIDLKIEILQELLQESEDK